jgi:hypothetical protein
VTGTRASTRTDAPTLEWEAFCAARFPHGRRHDFEAILAYGAYRRSRAVGERSSHEAAGIEKANGSPGSPALQGWEDEGGSV